MKRIALFVVGVALFSACSTEVTPDSGTGTDDGNGTENPTKTSGKMDLKVYVPKGSISTYAGESASAGENHIDSLYIDLFENGGATPINQGSFGSSKWTVVNDSTVRVGYEVDNITGGGTLTAVVYANRRTPKTLTGEIIDPNATPALNPDGSWVNSFYMSGPNATGTTLTRNATTGNYEGTVHIQRNVAKLRVNVSKSADCLPSDLSIDYSNISIRILKVPSTTTPFTSANASGGASYIDYAARTGTALRNASTFSATNGGQIDSLYLYENRRSTFTEGTNTTQIEITVPTTSVTGGTKSDTYTYSLNSSKTATPDYNIIRNYIYTFNMQIRGQGLAANTTLNILPWDDVAVNGDIYGTYLTLDKDEIAFDENGECTISFCTDAQAVYFDYSDFDDNNIVSVNDHFGLSTVGIENTNPDLVPAPYKGQILLDQQHCSSFGFQLDLNQLDPSEIGGKICMKAGNINKCISIVAKKTYDAHFIVGEELFNGDVATAAIVNNGGTWLQVSKDKLYTTNATSNFTGSSTLYLHLDENLTGASRSGSITATIDGSEKKIYITQLPALYIGRFGREETSEMPNTGYNKGLYTEQLYEFETMPKYNTAAVAPASNSIYNGITTTANATNLNIANYANNFNWQGATLQAINYCAYKNRGSGANGALTTNDIKWYLPSQAQLMAMWISYPSFKDVTTSDFEKNGNVFNTYWSSTANAGYTTQAQYLNFDFGNTGHYYSSQKYYARCVRSKADGTPAPTSSIVTNGGGYVSLKFTNGLPATMCTTTHKSTGEGDEASTVNATLYANLRVANSNISTSGMTWAAAKTACSGTIEGSTGWRLPTQRELQAIWILQKEMHNTVSAFNLLSDNYYWSATQSKSYTNNAWMVYGSQDEAGASGNTPNQLKTYNVPFVRCVKEL